MNNLEDLEKVLRKQLRFKTGSKSILNNREGTTLEFKESFNLGSLSRYERTMAAFANNQGGYIVFGVKPGPHRLVGVNPAFGKMDTKDVAKSLNAHLAPEIEWDDGEIIIRDFHLGFIYTHESRQKPIVTVLNHGSELKEGEIYYRYRGQSARIKYGELRNILDKRVERERETWMQHLQTITRVGPTNVALLDTVQGRVHGSGAPVLIDKSLLRQLRFIKDGKFAETGGDPTLRLIGDIAPIGGVVAHRAIPTGIHTGDLIVKFLGQQEMNSMEAKAYLVETPHQASPYLPLFYFLHKAGLDIDEARVLLKNVSATYKNTQKAILDRIEGASAVQPMGSLGDVSNELLDGTSQGIVNAVIHARWAKDKRRILVDALSKYPNAVREAVRKVPFVRLAEAVTHLTASQISEHKDEVLSLLLEAYNFWFGEAKGTDQSAFRKAVASVDERLFRPETSTFF